MKRRALQFAAMFTLAAVLMLAWLGERATCPRAQAAPKAAPAVSAPRSGTDAATEQRRRQQLREALIEELGLPIGLLADYAVETL